MKLKTILWGLWFLPLFTFAQNNELLFSPNGIAEIHITLADGKQIWDIQNEKATDNYQGKVKAEMTIRNSSASTYPGGLYNRGKILIDGRGNTSWHHDKRPYNIDLVEDDWDTTRSFPLLDMPEGEEWCLLAFWNDRSLMRYAIASYLGQYMTGMSWTPRMRYVEIWINNDYRGLYLLSEKIMRDKNRVDIKKLNAESTDLSGGYILESAPEDGHKSTPIEIATQIKTNRDGINFIFKYPKAKNVTYEQRMWIKNYLDEFENVLRSNDYKDPDTGYLNYINEDSFIDWTILHELSKGCDNLFHASNFVSKDRNGKLNMSSPWDFDLSFGNSGVYTEDGNWVKTHRWFGRLYQDERYAKKWNARYEELMKLYFNKIPQILQANYKQLAESGALDREFDRFPKILLDFVSDGDGRRTPTTYQGHVQFLSEWIMSRNNWVYINLGSNDEEKATRLKKIKPVIRVMDPEGMAAGRSFNVRVMKSEENNNKYTYSWNDSKNFSTSSSRAISQTGKYWVQIKDAQGNLSLLSDTLYVGIEPPTPTALPVVETNTLTYNNPAHEVLTINYIADKNIDLSIRLLDMKGMRMKEMKVQAKSGTNQIQIPVADFPKGLYILQLHTDKGIVTKKIICGIHT